MASSFTRPKASLLNSLSEAPARVTSMSPITIGTMPIVYPIMIVMLALAADAAPLTSRRTIADRSNFRPIIDPTQPREAWRFVGTLIPFE